MERSGDSGSLGFRYRHLHPPRYMDSRASSINTSHSALISEASGSHYNLDLADSPIQSGFVDWSINDWPVRWLFGNNWLAGYRYFYVGQQ